MLSFSYGIPAIWSIRALLSQAEDNAISKRAYNKWKIMLKARPQKAF